MWEFSVLSTQFFSKSIVFLKPKIYFKKIYLSPGLCALAGASYSNWKVVGSIPSLGTCLGCGFDPWPSAMGGNQSMLLSCIDVSMFFLSLPLSLSLSLKARKKRPWVRIKINK